MSSDAVGNERSGDLGTTIKDYPNLTENRVLTATITQAEQATLDGNRYYAEFVATVAAGATGYISWQNPVDSGVYVSLISRTFEAYDGAASQRILWDYTIDDVGTAVPVYNENNLYRVSDPAKFEVQQGVTITDPGIVRETDKIVAAGVGSNKSGDIKPAVGFRVYGPGTGYLFEYTNDESPTANEIKVAYTWSERPMSEFT